MKRILTLLVTLLTITPALAEPEKQTLIHSEKVGHWTVESYMTSDQRFSHCVAYVNYPAANAKARSFMRANEITMMVKLFGSENVGFGLGAAEWTFNPGKKYNIGFKFNQKYEFNVEASADNENVISAETPIVGAGEWFTRLAQSSDVELFIEGSSLGRFNLKNSERAMKSLGDCYHGSLQGQAEVENRTSSPFGEGR